VLDWKNQAIEILNALGFSVTDHGPLHGDIRTFKIRRDDCLTLFMDTEAARGGHFPRRAIPPGAARINPDNVILEKPAWPLLLPMQTASAYTTVAPTKIGLLVVRRSASPLGHVLKGHT
jgi:hypothetical protein